MLAEFDAQSGALHQEVSADQRDWMELVETLVGDTQARAELRRDADVAR